MNINMDLLILIISYAVGYGLVFYNMKIRHSFSSLTKITETGLFIHLFVWKLSYIPLHLQAFIDVPLSALYFTGGKVGFISSLLATLLYFIYKSPNQQVMSSLFFFTVQFLTIVFAIHNILTKEIIVGSLFILIILLYHQQKQALSYASSLLILSTYFYMTTAYGQWHFYLLLIGSSLVIIGSQIKKIQLAPFLIGALCIAVAIAFSNFPIKQQKIMNAIDWKQSSLTYETTPYRSAATLENKVIVLNFFASWCPPCKAELPQLSTFWDQNKNKKDFAFIGINATMTEKSQSDAASFIKKENIPFPIFYDVNGDWQDLFRVNTFPTTIVINKDGGIVKKHIGPISAQGLNQLVEQVNN
ncbi:MAG: TlpA family protein disulfide reductase [Bacillaceae bacterium]